MPLGDGPLFWILCQLAQIQLDASVHACTVAACKLHIAIRRLSLPSTPQEERYLLFAYCWLRLDVYKQVGCTASADLLREDS